MLPREKNKGNTVVLPNIPKMTDDKNRLRYMTDYEKYEPELLKHHLGPQDTTITVNLKAIPADFDRTVPSSSDLTQAEIEYERFLALRNARRKKLRGYSSTIKDGKEVTKSKPKPAAAPPVPSISAPTPMETHHSTPRRCSTAADTHQSADGSPGVDSSREHRTSSISGKVTANGTLACASLSTTGPPFRGPPPSLEGRDSPAEGSKVTRPSSASNMQPKAPSHVRGLNFEKKLPHGSVRASRAASVDGPAVMPSERPSVKPLSRASPSILETAATSRRVPSAPPQRAPKSAPLPTRSTANVSPVPSALSRSGTSRVEKNVVLTVDDMPEEVNPLTEEEARKYLDAHGPQKPNFTKVEPAAVGEELAACADLLRVLVAPPPEYAASAKLDRKGIEVDWIAGKRRHPPQLITLQNWQSVNNGRKVPQITSPRSALVLLRHGVSTRELVPNIPRDDDLLLPENPELRAAVKAYRLDREKAKRAELCDLLLSDYLSMCSRFSQQDLITAVNQEPEVHEQEEYVPTSLAEQQERQKKQFELNKIRIDRVNTLAKQLHEKRVAAEDRRRRAEREMQEAMEAKAKADAEARALQSQRLEKQRKKLREMELIALENLKKRQEMAEKRNQERVQAQERQFAQRQQWHREKEEERQRRFAEKKAQQEAQAQELQAKQELIAKKMEELEMAKLEKIEEEKRVMREKQLKVRAARREAAKRAAEKEENLREAARIKQAETEERIQQFLVNREVEARLRAEEEREKRIKRREAMQSAMLLHEEFRKKTKMKQLEHQKISNKLEQEKMLAVTMMREREREEMLGKAEAIAQLHRINEFKKLSTIAELIEKRRVAQILERRKAEILQRTITERDKLYAEKQELRRRLETAKV